MKRFWNYKSYKTSRFFPFFRSSRSCFSHGGYLLINDIYSLLFMSFQAGLTELVSEKNHHT